MRKQSIVAERLKKLRESVGLTQVKLAENFEGIDQPAVYRYESGTSFPPYSSMIQYADFFDVSLDYIYGRTDNPQGKLYENKPKVVYENPEMKEFIEMCLDPKSAAYTVLKETLFKIMEENNK